MGWFCWRRLPFRLCTAPEEFQLRLNHALEGLNGICTIHNGIVVFVEGSTEDEVPVDHKQNLCLLMQRCCEQNIKLNKDKEKLGCKEVLVLGHLILKDGLKAHPAKIKAVLDMPTQLMCPVCVGSMDSQITWASFYHVSVISLRQPPLIFGGQEKYT